MKISSTRNRRRFIQQAAALAGASTLEASLINSALAQENNNIKRVIFWWMPEGAAHQAFWPLNTGALAINPNATIDNLHPRSQNSSIRQYINNGDGPACATYCLQPLINHQQDISLYSGFRGAFAPSRMASDAHARAVAGALTGGTPGEGSIDQILGKALQGNTPIKSMYTSHWGHHAHNIYHYLSPVRTADGSNVGGLTGSQNFNPMDAYAQIFGNSPIPEPSGNNSGQIPYGDRHNAIEVLSSMEARIEQVKCVGGEAARKKYEVLLASYQELEQQTRALLQSDIDAASESGPDVRFAIPSAWHNRNGGRGDKSKYWNKAENFEKLMDISINTTVAALALNKTRVSMMQFSASGTDVGPVSNQHYRLLNIPGLEAGNSHDHHFGHDDVASKRRNQARIFRWYYGKLAQLIQKLKDTPDTEGTTLFDTTLIVTATEFSMFNHRFGDMPYLVAGGLGGTVKTGQYIDARKGNDFRSNAEFFHGIASALDVNLPRFGTSTKPWRGMLL